MQTTTIHIKTDKKTRDEAQKIAEQFGFSLTALVNAMLKQVVRTKQLTINADEEIPTQYMIDSLKQSEADVKAGRVISFKNPQEAIDYVSSLIENENTHTSRTD